LLANLNKGYLVFQEGESKRDRRSRWDASLGFKETTPSRRFARRGIDTEDGRLRLLSKKPQLGVPFPFPWLAFFETTAWLAFFETTAWLAFFETTASLGFKETTALREDPFLFDKWEPFLAFKESNRSAKKISFRLKFHLL
jgi:hypothetical protein